MAVDLPSEATDMATGRQSQGLEVRGSEGAGTATGAQLLLEKACGSAAGAYRPVLSAGWLLDRGAREYMEDTYCQALLTFSPQSHLHSQSQSQSQSQSHGASDTGWRGYPRGGLL